MKHKRYKTLQEAAAAYGFAVCTAPADRDRAWGEMPPMTRACILAKANQWADHMWEAYFPTSPVDPLVTVTTIQRRQHHG